VPTTYAAKNHWRECEHPFGAPNLGLSEPAAQGVEANLVVAQGRHQEHNGKRHEGDEEWLLHADWFFQKLSTRKPLILSVMDSSL